MSIENIFTREIRELSSREKLHIDSITDTADILYHLVDTLPDNRCRLAAKQKLEELVFWSNKSFQSEKQNIKED